MQGHIVIDGLNINRIIDEIKVSTDLAYSESPYVGAKGSQVEYVSETGRVITCSNLCAFYEESCHEREHRIDDYRYQAEINKTKPAVLTSKSHLDLKGNYLVTGFNVTEDTMGNFIIDWEFTEVMKFNTTKQTFRVWGNKNTNQNKADTKMTALVKKSIKYLYGGKCGTLKKGSSGTCVKALQNMLQSNGLYKGCTVDGSYGNETFKAVGKMQQRIVKKDKSVKVNGAFDKPTRDYVKKYYLQKYGKEFWK